MLNDIGETLNPAVVVLLIGERPGLATAESLSAYMAFRPRVGHDDSQRNLISNIHARGVLPEQAAERIGRLAELLIARGASGVTVKEEGISPLGVTMQPLPAPLRKVGTMRIKREDDLTSSPRCTTRETSKANLHRDQRRN